MQIGISSIKHNSPLHLIRNICLSHVGVGVMHTVYFVKCFSIRHYFGGIYTPSKCREPLHAILLPCTSLGYPWRKQLQNEWQGKQSRGGKEPLQCGREGVQRHQRGKERMETQSCQGAASFAISDPLGIWLGGIFTDEIFLIFQVFTFKEVKIIISSSRHPQRSSEMAIYKWYRECSAFMHLV